MLSARQETLRLGGRILADYPFISAVGADVSPYALENRGTDGGISVCVAERVSIDDGRTGDSFSPVDLRRLHGAGITGKSVGIAVIDTGVYAHIDFCVPRMRLTAFVDFVHGKAFPYDDHGHGTAVAGIACGGGRFSSAACGAAPQSLLAVLKAIDGNGSGNVLEILTAMQWLYTNFRTLRIRVVNMSLGSEPMGARDPLVLGVEALTSVGLTVVASAGNAGPSGGTLKSPGISRAAITVGGAEKDAHGWHAAEFSSRGTDSDDKPDLIAPAVHVGTCKESGGYMYMSGTSAAAPLVSGVCALILQENPSYTPAQVKTAVLASLKKLDCPHSACGAGLLCPMQ